MGFPIHTLVSFGGAAIGGGDWSEQWQVGIRCKKALDEVSIVDPDGWLTNIATPLQTWFTASSSMQGSTFRLGFVKCNGINADGTYIDPVTHAHYYTGSIAGSVSMWFPPAVTAAVTWTTAAARGLASKGRIYLPWGWDNSNAYGTPLLSSAMRTTMVTAAKALLTLIAGTVDPGGTNLVPAVVSRGKATAWDDHHRPTAWGTGAARAITGIEVGSRLDTQRRRQREIPESYTSVTFP